MDRPVSADTANKIIIHTNGGHRYASTQTFSKASGQTHIGFCRIPVLGRMLSAQLPVEDTEKFCSYVMPVVGQKKSLTEARLIISD